VKDLAPIDYIADGLYQADCAKRGVIGVRWIYLREDVARTYLKRAVEMFTEWAFNHRDVDLARQRGNPRAFFESTNKPEGQSK
jgi:hypothetical protein